MADGAFLIAGSQAPELLAAIDQPLDTVARAVHGTIKRAASALVALTGDGDSNVSIWPIYYFKDARTDQTVTTSFWKRARC
jgi:hypothetical protein